MGEEVTILLLAYNRADVIGRTVASIRAQSFGDYRCILMDDASTDDTVQRVRESISDDQRWDILSNASNLGMPDNLMRGLTLVDSPFAMIVHDGDILTRDALAMSVTKMGRYPNAGFAFSGYRFVGLDGETIRESQEGFPEYMEPMRLNETAFFRRRRFDSPVWGSALIRMVAIAQVGLPRREYGSVADVEWWMRLNRRWGAIYVREPLLEILDRDAWPSNWDSHHRTQRKRIREAFLAARIEAYSNQPTRVLREMVKHWMFCVGAIAEDWAVHWKAKLIGVARGQWSER